MNLFSKLEFHKTTPVVIRIKKRTDRKDLNGKIKSVEVKGNKVEIIEWEYFDRTFIWK